MDDIKIEEYIYNILLLIQIENRLAFDTTTKKIVIYLEQVINVK